VVTLDIIRAGMVEGCAIFTKAQGSRLDFPGFGDGFCQEEDNYVKMIII